MIATKGQNTQKYITAFILAFLPVLAPYSLFGTGLPLPDALIYGYTAYLFLTKLKTIKINPPFLTFLGITFLFSLLAFVVTGGLNYSLMIKGIIKNVIYFFCFFVLWSDLEGEKEQFFKAVLVVSGITCAFLLYQFLCNIIGWDIPSGILFGLPLDSQRSWASVETYHGIRLHSLFQEPSYFAAYTLFAAALSLRYNKYFLFLIQVACLIICTSTLGYLGLVLMLISILITNRNSKVVSFLFKMLLVAIPLHFILLYNIEVYQQFFEMSMQKITNLSADLNATEDTSASIRLIGYLEYFPRLPFINKFIGLGSGQFAYYFIAEQLYNYSNVYVVVLLSYGILGLASLLLSLLYIFFAGPKEDRIFVILFCIVAAVDGHLFNMYFFFMLAFMVIDYPKNISFRIRG